MCKCLYMIPPPEQQLIRWGRVCVRTNYIRWPWGGTHIQRIPQSCIGSGTYRYLGFCLICGDCGFWPDPEDTLLWITSDSELHVFGSVDCGFGFLDFELWPLTQGISPFCVCLLTDVVSVARLSGAEHVGETHLHLNTDTHRVSLLAC